MKKTVTIKEAFAITLKLFKDMQAENKALKKEVKELRKISDTCKKCGCNEFLCGHNAKG